MLHIYLKRFFLSFCLLCFSVYVLNAQSNYVLKYKNSSLYAGIDVGSKGVKLSVLEMGKNAKKSGAFNLIKDTSINTDFISFTNSTFQATLNALCKLYGL
jgi:activator of 2-hydroxyglutaryl-CoA dehydratase